MITYRTKDPQGNEIIVEDKSRISIKLRAETKSRCIGVVTDGVLIVWRKRQEHIWKNCYGFNCYILSEGKTFDKVKIVDEYGEYLIPVKTLLSIGNRQKRRVRSRFEKQIYLTIEQIEKYAIKEKVSI